MILYSCRDQNDPGDQKKNWKQGEYHTEIIDSDYIRYNMEYCVLFVHGFAAKPQDAIDAYLRMGGIYSANKIHPYGFTWPSEGKITPLNYYIDFFRHTSRTIPAFLRVVLLLCSKYQYVIIQAHSMGTHLVSEALLNNEIYELREHIDAKKIVLIYHGGDASRYKFDKNEIYGRNSTRINRLLSLHSENDLVLSTIGQIMRPIGRIGSAKIVDPPNNFISINAETLAVGEIVRHDTYKNNQKLIEYSVRYALNAFNNSER